MSTVEISNSTTPSRSTPPFQTPQTMSLVVQLGNAVCSSNLITTNQQSPLAATAIATNTLKSIGQFPSSPDVAASSSEVNTITTISSAAIISHQTPLVVTSQLQALYKKPIVANTVSTKVNASPNNGIARVQTVNVQRSVQLSHISQHNKMQVLTNLVVPKQNFVVNKVGSGHQLRAPNQQTTLQLGIGPKQLMATTPVVTTRPLVGSALNVINANKVIAKPPQILNNINLQKTNQSYITQQIPQQITVNNNVSNRNKFQQQTHVISRVITPVTTTKTPQTLKINAPQTTMVVQQRTSQLPGIKTLPPQTSPKAQQRIPNNVIRTGIKTIPPQRTNFKNQNVKSNKFILKNSPRVQQQHQPPQNHLLSPKSKQNHHHPIVVQQPNPVNRINTITTASSNILKYHGQQFQVVPMHNPNTGHTTTTQHITQPPGSNLPSMTVLRTVASYEDNNVPTNIANTLFSPASAHLENVDASQDNYLSEEDMISEVRPDYSKCLNPVLFDHNYHLPPPDSPPPSPAKTTQIATSSAISADINPVLLESHRNGILTNSNTSPPTNYLYNNNKLVNSKLNLPYQADNNLHQAQDDDAGSTISSDAGREVEPEGEETETAPEGEGDEDSVTRCICDFEHDDGYMICCDKCFVWQHVDCMFIDRQNIQEEYLCERCEPRRVYRQRARAIQLRKREEILNNGSSSDTSSASSNNSLLNNNISKKRPGNPIPQMPIPSIPTNIANRRKNEPGGAAQRNRSLTLQQRRARRDLSQSTAAARKNTVVKRRQERKVQTKRKTKIRRNQENQDDSQDAWDRKDSTLTQLRQWIENYEEAVTNHYSPELRQRLVKQNVQNSSSNLNNFHSLVQANANVHKCRTIPQTNLGTKILVSSIYLQANIPIIELRGKYMLAAPQTVATTPPGLISSRTQSQKPGPFVFFYKLPKYNIEVCVDTRTYGNDARFVRRSCKPNAEIRHCIEKGTLHLYLVSVLPIDKNTELTIKHDANVLPNSSCACGNPMQCALGVPVAAASPSLPSPSPSKISLPTTPATPNNSTLNSSATTPSSLTMVTRRSNGMAHDLVELNPQRKRRGRRTTSTSESDLLSPKEVTPKPTTPVPPIVIPPPPAIVSPVPVPEVIQPPTPIVPPPVVTPPQPNVQGPIRRSSQNTRVPPPPAIKTEEKSEPVTPKTEAKEEASPRESKEAKDIKKMTREERKMEAIMKAFERLEKQEQRKQESKTRQSHRRDSDVPYDSHESKSKRKKRKGRTRTVSTNSASGTRRTRLNSTDSYMTSGDESSLLSPPLPMSHDHESHPASEMDTSHPEEPELPKPEEQIKVEKLENTEGHAAGLLLALANGGQHTEDQLKSPVRDNDSSSAGSVQSSPGTPVSSNCLLVAAAVEQITPGFKFPKTKKAIMNEWLNKSPEPIQTPSLVPGIALNPHIARPLELPSILSTPAEINRPMTSLAQTVCSSTPNVHPTGNAKKRWLRQAISEECDSPNSRPESPHTNDVSAPPKKRRLARESVSSEQSFTPPTTPTRPNQNPTGEEFEDEFYSEEKALIDCLEDSNHKNSIEDEAQHHLNLIKERQENGMLLRDLEQHDEKNDSLLGNNFETTPVNLVQPNEIALRVRTTVPPVSLDPRLRYESPHCLDKVEETLQLLESWTYTPKHENVPPAKRKLSISEYRQRKQQVPNSDKHEKNQNSNDSTALNSAVNNTNDGSSESPRPAFRTRTNSSSSATSSLSSDDEQKDPTTTLLSSIDTILEKSASKPKLSAFNSAPTLLERQRENLTARLKREFGLSVPEDEEKKNSVESLGDTTILGQRISFRTNSFLAAVDSPLLDDKTSSSDTSVLQNPVTTPNKVDIVPSIPTTPITSSNSTNSVNYPSSAAITPTVPIQNGIKSTGSNINFITPFDNPAYSTNTTYYTGFASSKPPPPPFLNDGKTQPISTPPPTNAIIPRK